MADERVEGGLADGAFLHEGESVGCFFGDGRSVDGGEGPPGGPAQAHHLVQDAVAFRGERDCWDFRRDLWARLVSGGHSSLFPVIPGCKRLLYAVRRGAENSREWVGGASNHRVLMTNLQENRSRHVRG